MKFEKSYQDQHQTYYYSCWFLKIQKSSLEGANSLKFFFAFFQGLIEL